MTCYTVVWDRDVERPFTEAWIAGNSQTRATLSELANWLDATLAVDPDTKGEQLQEHSTRKINIPVASSSAFIEATYQIFSDDRLVRVVRLVFRSG